MIYSSNNPLSQTTPIICLGIMVADLVGGPMVEMPERGSLILVDEMGLYPGGCAVNTAVALRRLGLPVRLIGKIGQDALGDFLLADLKACGVDVQGVKRDDQLTTSATMVMVDPDGERRFVHHIGANAALSANDVDLGLVKESAILHVGGYFVMPGLEREPLAALLEDVRSAGVKISVDTAWDASGRWMESLAPCLPYIDYFVPSLAEARAITGLTQPEDVAKALIERGAGIVALKMGAAGALVMDHDGRCIRAPAYQVDVVDTTGAGDAFAAGFIAGVYLDWPLEETARLANAVGALCVTDSGAAGGVTTLEETIDFMRTGEERIEKTYDSCQEMEE
jgi:sugar/nucleoside kinase (ribokinase family)